MSSVTLTVNSPVKDFIAYVSQNNLYNPSNKMLVQCDNTLKELLGVDSFAFFGLERILEQKRSLVKETILADDNMSLEEIAAQILANLHKMPIDLSGGEMDICESEHSDAEHSETESKSSASTPSTCSVYEYKSESEEDVYEWTNEFQVRDNQSRSVSFMKYTKNGTSCVKINTLEFNEEDFIEYIAHLLYNGGYEKEDRMNEGIVIGGLSVFLVYSLFCLWLSIVNHGLCRMG